METYRQDIFDYVTGKYGSTIEYPWRRYLNYAVFRHEDNKKWYGLLMDVPKKKLGLSGEDIVDILNVKLDDPMFRDILMKQSGILPGYHISRGNWISILLDGTVPLEQIYGLIDVSFMVTASKARKQKNRPPLDYSGEMALE